MSQVRAAVENRAHAEALTGMKEGDVVYNRELDAKMALKGGKWVTFTDTKVRALASLLGYVFCLTGKMWTTREKIESAILTKGGTISRTMSLNAILVQGTVAGGSASKKQRHAALHGQKTISSNDLNVVLEGHVGVGELFGGRKKKSPPVKAQPIDRDRQNATVKQVMDDIESITFGK